MNDKSYAASIDIGDQIKKVRETLKLNQKEFARKIGLSNGYLCDVENGKRHPGNKLYSHFSERLNVSLDWLILGKGNMFCSDTDDSQPDNLGDTKQIPQVKEFLEIFHKSPFVRFSIMAFATSFILNNEEMIKKDIEKNQSLLTSTTGKSKTRKKIIKEEP